MEAPEDASFSRMAELQRGVAEAIAGRPGRGLGVTSVVGAGIVNPAQNTGRLTAVLRPRDDRGPRCRRHHRADAAAASMRCRASPSTLQPVQDIQIGARPGSTAFQYTLMDPDPVELGHWAPMPGTHG